jgi:nucleotide-binding universal stress UspA family protein
MRENRQRLFRSVLCPVDFSDHSRLTLRYAATVARRAGGKLQVLFVNDPLLVAAAAAAYNRQELGAASMEELSRFVHSTLSPRAASGLTVSYEVSLGKPVAEILRAADRFPGTLVVVGTKGLNGARRLLLGSTTTALLRKTHVPVLAIPPARASGLLKPPASWPGRQIVVPVELSEHTSGDLARAAGVARWFGASLVLVHAVDQPPLPSWYGDDARARLQERTTEARRLLDTLTKTLHPVRASVIVRSGYPPDEITAVAARQKAGLIVMTLRRRPGIFGRRAGAFSYDVLCRTTAPVLALPGSPRAGDSI